jgi:nicotinate-nucleotide adenylyltransferase
LISVKRIGILGGSFNPIHHAHLFTAEVVAAGFHLDRVLLIPAAQSPLKQQSTVPAAHRVEMVRLAAAGNPLLEVSTIEIDRPPPSYMVDTLALLRSQYAAAELYLILGMDALVDLLEWRAPAHLLDLAQIVAVSRPGFDLVVPSALNEALGHRADRILLQPMPKLEISSTDIRRRLAQGEPVRYLLPDSVERYLRTHRLYGATGSS